MKTIKILILLFIIGTFKSYAGDVKSIEVANGIIQIKSSNSLRIAYAVDDKKQNLLSTNTQLLVYGLDLYTNGDKKQYFLRMGVKNSGHNVFTAQLLAGFIPIYGKILLKLFDDSVIELSSIYKTEEKDGFGHFYLSDNNLLKIFEGVKKIRVEIITYDPKTGNLNKEYRDVNYDKDKFGKNIKDLYKDLNKEYEKRKNDLLKKIEVSTITNINEGF